MSAEEEVITGYDSSAFERIELRPAYRGQIRSLAIFAVLSAGCIYFSARYPITIVKVELWRTSQEAVLAFIPILIFLPFAPLLRAIIYVYDSRYVIDDVGVEAQIGRLSIKLRQPRLRWEDIRGSALKQGLWERILNIGTIEVDSAMTDDVEIVMSSVESPRRVHQLIQRERERRWRESGHLWHIEKALTD